MKNKDPFIIPNSSFIILIVKYPSVVFLALLLVCGAPLSWRILNILPLYTDADTRSSVRTALTEVSDREGWLLSNVSLDRIVHDRIFVTYSDHRRGDDPEKCLMIMMNDHSLLPCDDKRN